MSRFADRSSPERSEGGRIRSGNASVSERCPADRLTLLRIRTA